jgi:hypothetical protein
MAQASVLASRDFDDASRLRLKKLKSAVATSITSSIPSPSMQWYASANSMALLSSANYTRSSFWDSTSLKID